MLSANLREKMEDREPVDLSKLGPWCGLSAPSMPRCPGRTRALSFTATMIGEGMHEYWRGNLEDDNTARRGGDVKHDDTND